MKIKPTELDVDFIGGMAPLTKAEEARISEIIKAAKQKRAKKQSRKAKTLTRKKVA
jgi:hypothetical protein